MKFSLKYSHVHVHQKESFTLNLPFNWLPQPPTSPLFYFDSHWKASTSGSDILDYQQRHERWMLLLSTSPVDNNHWCQSNLTSIIHCSGHGNDTKLALKLNCQVRSSKGLLHRILLFLCVIGKEENLQLAVFFTIPPRMTIIPVLVVPCFYQPI